jgi:nitrous oxide reductase accessory protein NosL
LKFARPAADGVEDTGAADGMDAVAAPASVVVDDAVEPAAPTAPAAKKSFKKRPIDPERAATKFVKTATNAATWKNPLLYGSLAFAVLLPVALLALAHK